MTAPMPVINTAGDYEETIIQLARHLGTAKIRRQIFTAVSGRVTKPRSIDQLMQAEGISGAKKQQVRNSLDSLSKHGLIDKVPNDGIVSDGSRNLYKKNAFACANKHKIIRFADNPIAANKVATKRRPVVSGFPVRNVTRASLKRRKRLSVLYLAANPDKQQSLRLDEEVSRVQNEVRASRFRDNINVIYRPAATLKSLLDGLNDHRPQVVHFSGHGYSKGIATDNASLAKPAIKVIRFDLLAKALNATDHPPDVIVLNSCGSSEARRFLLPPGKIAILMRGSVSDHAAVVFATTFYGAVSGGQSVQKAFEQGRVMIESMPLSDVDTPQLICASGINPAKHILT